MFRCEGTRASRLRIGCRKRARAAEKKKKRTIALTGLGHSRGMEGRVVRFALPCFVVFVACSAAHGRDATSTQGDGGSGGATSASVAGSGASGPASNAASSSTGMVPDHLACTKVPQQILIL